MTDPLNDIYEAEDEDSATTVEAEEERQIADELKEREEDAHAIQFTGYAGPAPFLIESPLAYTTRLAQAATALIATPDDDEDGGPAGRVLYSPALSLPFILPIEGDRMHERARSYPLLNTPEGRDYDDPELPVDAYALAVTIAYETPEINFMGEDGHGNILTWDDIPRYAVPDKFWSRALDLAGRLYDPLRALNLARLVRFSQPEPAERGQLAILCQAWQIDDTPKEIIEKGDEATETIAGLWPEIAPDTTFDPYR